MNRSESELFDSTVAALAWIWSQKITADEYDSCERVIDSLIEKEGDEAFDRVRPEAYKLSLDLLYSPSH